MFRYLIHPYKYIQLLQYWFIKIILFSSFSPTRCTYKKDVCKTLLHIWSQSSYCKDKQAKSHFLFLGLQADIKASEQTLAWG